MHTRSVHFLKHRLQSLELHIRHFLSKDTALQKIDVTRCKWALENYALDVYTFRKESRAREADRCKRAPTTLSQQIYPRNGGHPRHFLGNIMGYASHSHINDHLFPIKYCLLLAYMISVVSYYQLENKSSHLKKALLLPLPPSPACLFMVYMGFCKDILLVQTHHFVFTISSSRLLW